MRLEVADHMPHRLRPVPCDVVCACMATNYSAASFPRPAGAPDPWQSGNIMGQIGAKPCIASSGSSDGSDVPIALACSHKIAIIYAALPRNSD